VLTATHVLTGLRYDEEIIAAPKREGLRVGKSITYQETVRIGKQQGLRDFILNEGKRRFGTTNRRAAHMVQAVTNQADLERLGRRIFEVNSWDQFLGGHKGPVSWAKLAFEEKWGWMVESVTFHEIVRIGELEAVRGLILRHGKCRFGRASHKAAKLVESIDSLRRLQDLLSRVPEANSWDEFLADQ
jgi:hypothetical protein